MNRRKLIKSAAIASIFIATPTAVKTYAGPRYLQLDKRKNPEQWSKIKEVYFTLKGRDYGINLSKDVFAISVRKGYGYIFLEPSAGAQGIVSMWYPNLTVVFDEIPKDKVQELIKSKGIFAK